MHLGTDLCLNKSEQHFLTDMIHLHFEAKKEQYYNNYIDCTTNKTIHCIYMYVPAGYNYIKSDITPELNTLLKFPVLLHILPTGITLSH